MFVEGTLIRYFQPNKKNDRDLENELGKLKHVSLRIWEIVILINVK